MSDKIITSVEGDLGKLLHETAISRTRTGYVKVDGFVLVNSYSKFSRIIEDFDVRDNDVWICSFPKSGTTWTQEMVWCIANDLDFERAKVPLEQRFPFFEMSYLLSSSEMIPRDSGVEIPEHLRDSFSLVEKSASPRFIKTHLPFNLLPRVMRTGEKRPKIVYVIRDAKDTCISYYHHMKNVSGFEGSFDDFCTLFVGDTLNCAPYWGHVLSFWGKRSEDNVLILKYEDMQKDLPSEIERTAKFLGKSLTDDQVAALAEHLKFDNMKANPAVNKKKHVATVKQLTLAKTEVAFMRIGKSEQWKTVMSTDVINKFDDWAQRNLKDTGFSYDGKLL